MFSHVCSLSWAGSQGAIALPQPCFMSGKNFVAWRSERGRTTPPVQQCQQVRGATLAFPRIDEKEPALSRSSRNVVGVSTEASRAARKDSHPEQEARSAQTALS